MIAEPPRKVADGYCVSYETVSASHWLLGGNREQAKEKGEPVSQQVLSSLSNSFPNTRFI
jgi:hypothetical protein